MGNVINENKGFESISRNLIFDNTLSDRARFVYVYMSAKPEDWEFYVSHMCKELGYSENTLRKYIDELLKTGWLERHEQKRKEDGTLGATQYVIKSSCDTNRPQFHRGTNFTARQNYRDGKFGTQRNIEYKEIKINEEINNINIENSAKPQNENAFITDFDTVFNETARRMKEDDLVKMQLSGYRITNMDALMQEFKRHIIKNFKQEDFINDGYKRNCVYLSRAMRYLDLSEATGKRLGPGEYFNEHGKRCYRNRRGNEIVVPHDAPPRRSEDNIWDPQEQRWSIE